MDDGDRFAVGDYVEVTNSADGSTRRGTVVTVTALNDPRGRKLHDLLHVRFDDGTQETSLMTAGVRRVPPGPSASDVPVDADSISDDTSATVCMRHYRFVPCRRCSEPTPGFWSTEQTDVDLVRRVQQRRTPSAPDLGLGERLTAVVHDTLAAGGSDSDVAAAILAMPEILAIRRALCVDADLHAANTSEMTPARWLTQVVDLPQSVTTWVLG